MNIAQAYLSNDKDMIKFQYKDRIIRFREVDEQRDNGFYEGE